jgi:hypothetical protein
MSDKGHGILACCAPHASLMDLKVDILDKLPNHRDCKFAGSTRREFQPAAHHQGPAGTSPRFPSAASSRATCCRDGNDRRDLAPGQEHQQGHRLYRRQVEQADADPGALRLILADCWFLYLFLSRA